MRTLMDVLVKEFSGSMAERRIALIVNPIAGIGGPMALHGSDGALADRALAVGAQAHALERTALALSALAQAAGGVRVIGCSDPMGEAAARLAGLPFEVAYRPPSPITTRDDSIGAARALIRHAPDLLLFAGGDGTACDLLQAIDGAVPVLGIPAGVKMHSAIFATSPRTAGALAGDYLMGALGSDALIGGEVIDRGADGAPELFGTLTTLRDSRRRQAAKATGSAPDAMLEGAGHALAREIADDPRLTLIGPGSTMLAIKQALGIDGTLLGVDVVQGNRLIAKNADRDALIALTAETPARLVLGVIGGQGFILGRGNQQIGGALVRRLGRANIAVVASLAKLNAIASGALLVDTGDDAADAELAGYLAVRTGTNRTAMMRVAKG